jgi:hypothetical protein
LASDNPARDRRLAYPLAWPLMILELWFRAVLDDRAYGQNETAQLCAVHA